MLGRTYFLRGTALAALVLLAACGGGSGGGGGSAVAMQQGQWETTAELTKMDLSNLPPEMRAELDRRPPQRTSTTRGCWVMSADLVRIENLRFTIPDFYTRGAGCTAAELVMEGGTLRGRMSCTGLPAPRQEPGGRGTMTVSGEMNGSYTPTTVNATMSGEIRFGAHSGSGEVRITSRRLGDCPPPPVYRPPVYGPEMGEGNMLAPVPVPVPPAPIPMPPAPPRRHGNSM